MYRASSESPCVSVPVTLQDCRFGLAQQEIGYAGHMLLGCLIQDRQHEHSGHIYLCN